MSQQPIFGITNIPQDIKLELNNGTLTLKAGSKVYVPNGSGVFDAITIVSDLTAVLSSSTGEFPLFYDQNSNTARANAKTLGSGTIDASGSSTGWWYNTSSNKIYYWNGNTQGRRGSFPLAIISIESGSVTKINQVFNGFGYIGSTYFILPDVEGFYPNGKDGFKNIFKTVKSNSVGIYNFTTAYTNVISALRTNGNAFIWSNGFEVVDKLPNIQDMVTYKRYYSKFDNKVYVTNDRITLNTVSDIPWGYFSTGSSSPYNISSLNIVNPFVSVDFYDYVYASYEPLSQYANSPRFMDLYNNICGLFNNSKTLEDWFNVVYNLKTASGFGLDIWGTILNQGRQFSYEENGVVENIFLGGKQTIDGITYSAEYMEEMYRMVLFLKALGYITNCTLASLNNLLQYYFADKGRVYVINYGTMEIRYVFEFYVSKLEKAIFTADVLPKPTGVLANFEYIPLGEYFGFYVDGIADPEDQPFAPFDNKPFYS